MEILKTVLPYAGQFIIAVLAAYIGVRAARYQDMFRSDLKRKEIYQQHILERKVRLCNKLLSELLLFISEAQLIQQGVEPLRFRKDPRVSGEVSEEDREHSRKLSKILTRMSRIVSFNQLYLGPQVVAAWHDQMSTFGSLQIYIETSDAPDLMLEIDSHLNSAYGVILQAVRHELKDAGVDLIAPATIRSLRKTGQARAKEIIAAAKKDQETPS